MPDLRIKDSQRQWRLAKGHGRSFKALTLFDALKNTTVIKKYNEQFEKEFGRPSVFASPTKDHGHKKSYSSLIV
jgi:hypothetical protein